MSAAQKQLGSSHVPAAVTQGRVASLGRMAGTNQLRLAISLPLRNAAALTNLLRDIYDPASPQFHHYLTPAEFTARFGPTPEDYAAVQRFAQTNGLTIVGTHPNRLLVDVKGRATDVERTFHVRMQTYRHPKEKRNFFAPDAEPSVDGTLPILHVSGLDNYSLPHPNVRMRPALVNNNATPHSGSGPGGGYIGGDFRKAYFPDTPLTGAGQSIALLQFDAFYFVDITNYANVIGMSNLPSINVIPINGGVSTPGSGDLEVSLDIEMLLAMAPGISNIYVYEAPNPSPWPDILSQMVNDNLVKQISCSWGGGGPDAGSEQIFQQMAAQGQSFFNATGDSDAFTGFIPFPSESPNITQVGGTTLTTDDDGNYVSETVWNWGISRGSFFDGVGSSGGISPVVPIPLWQLGVSMDSNQGSPRLRNVPDVAFTADNIYVTYGNGTNGFVGGTSCAAPLWAGLTALLNEQAGQMGQPPLGFLNPRIYAICRGTNYATTFHDITNGDNTWSSSPTNFIATPGFDLCTGWGTPFGTNFINEIIMPDSLVILPQNSYKAYGLVGGPFTQTSWSITLTNISATDLNWAIGDIPGWLTISAASGSLAANSSTNLTLELVGAEMLSIGSHLATLSVTNGTQARVESLAVELDLRDTIVLNGGFETGDFTGWTLVGNTTIGTFTYNAVATEAQFFFGGIVHSGFYGAFLGEGGFLATWTQTLPTQPGQLYQLSFWLDNPVSDSGQEFTASWNGTNLVDLVDPPPFIWTEFRFVVAGAGTNTDLQFGGRNDPNYFGLDDISVTPIPPVRIKDTRISGNDVQFTWDSLAGVNYEIQVTTNLAPVNWQGLGTIVASTNVCGFADMNVVDTMDQRFYRLMLMP